MRTQHLSGRNDSTAQATAPASWKMIRPGVAYFEWGGDPIRRFWITRSLHCAGQEVVATRRRRHDGRPDAQTHVAPSDEGVRTGCLMMLLRRKREGGRRWRWMGPNAAGRRSDDRLAMLVWFGVLYLTGTMVFLAGPAEHRRSDRTWAINPKAPSAAPLPGRQSTGFRRRRLAGGFGRCGDAGQPSDMAASRARRSSAGI